MLRLMVTYYQFVWAVGMASKTGNNLFLRTVLRYLRANFDSFSSHN